MTQTIKVSREKFLTRLKLIQPGLLAKGGLIEQGNCILFKNGRIVTFNDQILCQATFDLAGLEGAIQAAPLISLIESMEEEEIKITRTKNKLRILGKDKGAEFLFHDKITMKLEVVEKPKEWLDLSDRFGDAVTLVKDCASKKANDPVLSAIHIHPEFVEATDTYHFARFTLGLPVKQSILVPEVALKNIIFIEPRYIAHKESGNWIHFTDKKKRVMYSCRCGEEKYINTESAIKADKGKHVTLPKGLFAALKRSNIFSSEQPINKVIIDLLGKQRKVRVRSLGISTKFFENEDIAKYKGKDISFAIHTKMLMEMSKKHTDMYISDKALRVEAGSYVYIARISPVGSDSWEEVQPPQQKYQKEEEDE